MNYFDKDALTWDTERAIKRAKVISEKIFDTIKTKKDGRVLEWGCGTGLVSFNLKDQFKEIVLMDSSKGMIDVLKDKIKVANAKNMQPVHMDFFTEDFDGAKFDAIYNSMALHHVADTNGAVKKFFDMLNPGGKISIVELDAEDGSFHGDIENYEGLNGFEHDYLRGVFEKVGFKNIKIETFYSGIRPVLGRDVLYTLFCIYAEK
ncbi:MAG: class I SAM-dependent methyltransferase [Firmicutes bacterium]|nr:class I SAM-dependent methyltransferase [Bacillota bacterium]